jgi:HemY protein
MLGGVGLAMLFVEDPGFVVLGFKGYLIRTKLSLFILAMLFLSTALFIVGALLHHFWSLPTRWRRDTEQRRKRKAAKALTRGLLSLIEGQWKRAEEALNNTAPFSLEPLMHYLGAARAAHHLKSPERREAYLKLAEEVDSNSALAVAVTRAELQLDSHEYVQAKHSLAKLRASHPNHRHVLRLYYRLHNELQDWQEIVELLPALRYRNAFPPDQLTKIENEAHLRQLRQANDTTGLERIWSHLPASLKQQADAVEAYAERCVRLGQGAKALPSVEKILRTTWNPALVRWYGLIDGDDRAAQITLAEQWLLVRSDDAELQFALGRLCFRHGLWGKARYYLENSIKKEPRPESYRLLAETLERIGDNETAAIYCRKGLLLATGG